MKKSITVAIVLAGMAIVSVALFYQIGSTQIESTESLCLEGRLPDGTCAGSIIIDVKRSIEISGEDAWAICSALKIPCPSNPIFRGEKLDEFTRSVVFTGPQDVYEIILNKTHVCVTSTQAKKTECSLR